ncbi:LOB domain-containing protein 25 [Linum perenne]
MAAANSSSSTTTNNNYTNSPCAACKFLRRKCLPECIFAPYFPPEEPHKFANVHKIFGASNVSKLLNEVMPHQREDAVNSLAYEAEARLKDPVYGCVGAISVLQRQVIRLQKELDATNADLIRYAYTPPPATASSSSSSSYSYSAASSRMNNNNNNNMAPYGGGGFNYDHQQGYYGNYNSWNNNEAT